MKNKKLEIISAACSLFLSPGYRNTSLNDIAKCCGITKQAVAHHFGTKENLGRIVDDYYSAVLRKAFDQAVLSKGFPTSGITYLVANLAWRTKFHVEDPNYRRFNLEFSFHDLNFPHTCNSVMHQYWHDLHQNGEAEAPMEDLSVETKAEIFSIFYGGKGLFMSYANDLLPCSVAEFQYIWTRHYLKPMHLSQNEFQQAYDAAMDMLQAMGDIPVNLVDMLEIKRYLETEVLSKPLGQQ